MHHAQNWKLLMVRQWWTDRHCTTAVHCVNRCQCFSVTRELEKRAACNNTGNCNQPSWRFGRWNILRGTL